MKNFWNKIKKSKVKKEKELISKIKKDYPLLTTRLAGEDISTKEMILDFIKSEINQIIAANLTGS